MDRIHNSSSLHEFTKSGTACKDGLWPNQHKGPWRVIDCCNAAGDDRDVIECAECGTQKTQRCNFDEDFS